MFAHREWIVPMVNGAVYTDKPIFYFWMVLLGSYPMGGVTEWAVRLPSAASATGLALLTYGFGKSYFGRPVGFLAALVLATTARVLWEARWAHTDLLFTLFFVSSLYFLVRVWLGQNDKKDAFLAYAFMGLATLTKGLIGFFLPGLIVFLLLVLTKQWGRLRALQLGKGTGGFCVVTLPWFVAVGLRTDGHWIVDFIWRHHFQRYLAGAGHEEPFYYYFVNFPLDFLPWSVILIPAVAAYWPPREALGRPVPLFLTVWFAAVFLFFSLSNTKRALYLLPLFPPAALLVAQYLWDLETDRAGGGRAVRIVGYLICAVFVLSAVAVPSVLPQFLPASRAALLPLALVLAGGGYLVVRNLRAGRFFPGAVCFASSIALSFLCVQYSIIPVVNPYKSPRVLAAQVNRLIGAQDKLFVYADSMHDYNFYLEREKIPILSSLADVNAAAAGSDRVYLLIRERKALRTIKGDPRWEIVMEAETSAKHWYLLRWQA
jgi:4-amino-4-deoxy-L-arabinose transferase-like glycosyltransferase